MVCLPWVDSDQCFNVSDAYFRWLFRMTVPNDNFGCLFWMTFPDDCFGCLFVIPRLILILGTNSYFHGRFLFQAIIRLICPTIDSFLNDSFVLQNYGPDPPWYNKDIRDFDSTIIHFIEARKLIFISMRWLLNLLQVKRGTTLLISNQFISN